MAIARDNSQSGSGAFTTSGTNRLLLLMTEGSVNSDDVSAATYGGVSMTKLGGIIGNSSSRSGQLFYLFNPALGSNSFSITGGVVNAYVVSYNGVLQGSLDSSNSGAGSSTSLTLSTTVVASLCWTVMGMVLTSGSAWNGGTAHVIGSTADGGCQFFDSNGTVGTGSQSLNASGSAVGGGSVSAGFIVSFAPVVSANGNFLMFM